MEILSKIKRKPPPALAAADLQFDLELDLELRYPTPDPTDPFAPLWVLRSRGSNASLKHSAELYGPATSTPHKRSQSTPPSALLAFPVITADQAGDDTKVGDDSAPLPRAQWPQRLLSRTLTRTERAPSPTPTPVPPTPTESVDSSSFVHVSHISTPSHSTSGKTHYHPSAGSPSSPSFTRPRPAPTPSPVPPSPHSPSPSPGASQTTRDRLPRSRSTPALNQQSRDRDRDRDRDALPTLLHLSHAATLPLISPSGQHVPFSSLFTSRPTIVIFLRHFWCPYCQDYAQALSTLIGNARTLRTTPNGEEVGIVLIGNGSPGLIDKYKSMFGLNCEMYVDPTMAIYETLGMGRVGDPSAPDPSCDPVERSCTPHPPTEKETPGDKKNGKSYVRHGTVSSLAHVAVRALRARLPVWEHGGDIQQLGGEFVLGPGLQCTYAHRMLDPRGHAPVRTVLAQAGVELPVTNPPPLSSASSTNTIRAPSRTASTSNMRPSAPALFRSLGRGLNKRPASASAVVSLGIGSSDPPVPVSSPAPAPNSASLNSKPTRGRNLLRRGRNVTAPLPITQPIPPSPSTSLTRNTTITYSHQRADPPLPRPQRHRNGSLDSSRLLFAQKPFDPKKDAEAAAAQEALTDWTFGLESAAEAKWMEELEVLKTKKDVRRGFVDSGREGSGQGQAQAEGRQGKGSFVSGWEDGGGEGACACGVVRSVSTSGAKSRLRNLLEERLVEEGETEEDDEDDWAETPHERWERERDERERRELRQERERKREERRRKEERERESRRGDPDVSDVMVVSHWEEDGQWGSRDSEGRRWEWPRAL
ncbi:hypothetical protein DXG01_014882 [Tephrocybe rancida]|nr:hypothetical protein DXG01_014882 [Tephrocybe rancida]